jgi:hypothetical protein
MALKRAACLLRNRTGLGGTMRARNEGCSDKWTNIIGTWVVMAPSGNPFRQSVRVLGLFIRSQLIIAAVDMLLYATGFSDSRHPSSFRYSR